MEPDMPLIIPLGGGALHLPDEESKMLLALARSPFWDVMRKVLIATQEAAQVTLRDRAASLEDMRFEQGRIAAVQDLARLLDEDIPHWYNTPAEEQ